MESIICGWLARSLHIHPPHRRRRLYRPLCLLQVLRLETSNTQLTLDTPGIHFYRGSNGLWLDVLWHLPLLHDDLHTHDSQGNSLAEMSPLVIGGLFARMDGV